MTVVGAAFCPHPPLLVPELAAGAAGELDALRTACDAAVAALASLPAARIVVVGGGTVAAEHGPGAVGSLAGYGLPLAVPLGAPAVVGGPRLPLPLSLTLGAWLLRRAGWTAAVRAVEVPGDLAPESAVAVGARLADVPAADGLLVMGDGSACRSEQAPGWYDERAAAVDAAVLTALASGDPAGLAVDPALAEPLRVAGRAAWDVARGATAGVPWRARLCYDGAPYGVCYPVAVWTRG